LTADANRELLKGMFDAKRVPLRLLTRIRDHREFHRPDFASVKDTVKPNVRLRDFDFYFDYVVTLVESLQPFGIE